MIRILVTLYLFIFIAVVFLVTPFTFADAQDPLLPECNGVPGRADSCDFQDLVQLVINIYNYLLYFASFVALLMIVWAGVRMLWFSYLENSEEELKSAKLTLTRAIVGLVIIIAAYLIVNTTVLFLTGKDLNSFLP